VCLFAEWDTALLTIPKQRQKPRIRVELHTPANGTSSAADDVDTSTLRDELDSAEEFATKIRNALKIEGTSKILLAIPWTVDMARELLAMFPEATACDVSFGTNNEKLPLALLVAKTANNQTFTATRSFLPSQCRWAFHWLFWAVAHPTLHGEKTVSRNRACAMDGDVNLYGPFEALCGSVYPNSCDRKCVWHQYNRGMESAGFPARRNHLHPKGSAF
jgi:hypothetical protein